MRIFRFFLLTLLIAAASAATASDTAAVRALIDRIAPGRSADFELSVCQLPDSARYFELYAAPGGRVGIRANDNLSLSTGFGWYLKHHTGNQICWNNMTATLPGRLPLPSSPERHVNPMPYTYYLNYCTHSYSMAFWDSQRWQQEIDWMALHGVNLPLMLGGAELLWNNVMERFGYSPEEIEAFIAGPAFQAWWLMNNLEGWGGPSTEKWNRERAELQKLNIRRMRELDIHPVLPGYAGMVPHDSAEKLGLNVADPGRWCDFVRPAFLQPTDSSFAHIADIYYDELTRLFGKADFYAIDPFHEGGNSRGVDLAESARRLNAAMKRANPDAKWVIQGWQENPRREILEATPAGDMVVLDLWAEAMPQWGDTLSPRRRPDGYGDHEWIQCMLLNYGGNVGLHGKMQSLPESFRKARDSRFAETMVGVGLTMEGIENNPVMYEMMTELPWLDTVPDADTWLESYIRARYSMDRIPGDLDRAWKLLAHSIYDSKPYTRQQGTTESVFCARPALDIRDASSWAGSEPYYNPDDVILAASLFDLCRNAGIGAGNNNFEYDYVDIMRQANAERARRLNDSIAAAFRAGNLAAFDRNSAAFLRLMERQDSLLATRPEFRLSTWLDRAREVAPTEEDIPLMEWNARLLISTWGDRAAADRGGLHDYGNREWNGMLSPDGLYGRRWRLWLRRLRVALADGRGEESLDPVDWYEVESAWVEEPLREGLKSFNN
ncbi:MAG: alpha-N-acetylglucosaminidase [Clostridium sp.]|nr:alpha-N-acetylglucosaminidase [Clostridium sp.]